MEHFSVTTVGVALLLHLMLYHMKLRKCNHFTDAIAPGGNSLTARAPSFLGWQPRKSNPRAEQRKIYESGTKIYQTPDSSDLNALIGLIMLLSFLCAFLREMRSAF